MKKSLTLKDRKLLEYRYACGDSAVHIADEMGFSRTAIYNELKRGQDGTLDENFRLRYDAALGQKRFQEAMRRRGGRPKKVREVST